MPRYLIEVNHDDVYHACLQGLEAIEKHGSHFLSRADWGCHDGVHTGWLIADVADRETARQIVPPELRKSCRVVQLNKWSREGMIDTLGKVKPED